MYPVRPIKCEMYGVCVPAGKYERCGVIQVSSGEYGMYVIVFHGVSSTVDWVHDR